MKTILLTILLGVLLVSAPASMAENVTVSYASATSVPVTATTYTATGNTVDFTLGYAPVAGTNLTVVRNTGLSFIQGNFDNLTQGQAVNLTYSGVTYAFVANYYGGTGNDLVLQWAKTRLLGWGLNDNGRVGDGSTTDRKIPTSVEMAGVLAGKSITAISAGGYHNLALCSDGTLAAWGLNSIGSLGNGSTSDSFVPIAVDRTGVLSGRTVVAISSRGWGYSLALCSDGTLAVWGNNIDSTFGDIDLASSSVPVRVSHTGALLGRTIVAISAGTSHVLALCSDGRVAAWGTRPNGLGDGITTSRSSIPVLVKNDGVILGKSVVAISAGEDHSLLLCSDGTVAAWGQNTSGQLGDNSTTNRTTPVLVNRSGVLAGKTVTSIAAGKYHSMALCSDGTVATWGYNSDGELGNNSKVSSIVPVLVDRSGVLSGKRVDGISAGPSYNLARCTDGTMVSWGDNQWGQLGNGTRIDSSVPVFVNSNELGTGERFLDGVMGPRSWHALALISSPPPPVVTMLVANGITDTTAVLNSNINASGSQTTISFDYGLTTSYGSKVASTPGSVSGATATAASVKLTGLAAGTTYHFRAVAHSAGGIVKGANMTFTTSTAASLSGLTLSSGTLAPALSWSNVTYGSVVASGTNSITVSPAASSSTATIRVNGTLVESGATSAPISLEQYDNVILISVTGADGSNSRTYSITVTRLPAVYAFQSPESVPVTVRDWVATGNTVAFALNHAPPVGTALTVVKCTGRNPIRGTFDNLPQGQRVTLAFGGITYDFVANYFGGDGNDLVLHWANTRMLGWGFNGYGAQGNGGSLQTVPTPVAVVMTGVLAGKSVIAVSAGITHSLALCSDGTVAAWGYNQYGQLGDGNWGKVNKVPVLVDRSGVLAGKTVVAVAAGGDFSLALCSDGTVASWGGNMNGQLGANGTIPSSVPIALDMSGVLSGKTVTAVAAGDYFGLALCSDGTLASWGWNNYGQLGNGTGGGSIPSLVDKTGVLAGRTITAISAGYSHSLALCSDGSVAAWGSVANGLLGNNRTRESGSDARLPKLVEGDGVFEGKTITAVDAGGSSNLALCSDGTMAAWGALPSGTVGNASFTESSVPVLVDRNGALSGRTVVAISAGSNCLALCGDGALVAWGYNGNGQLGNNSTVTGSTPVLVSTSSLTPDERIVAGFTGLEYNLALVASPPPLVAATLAVNDITSDSTTLNGMVNARNKPTTVLFEFGPDQSYGNSVSAIPATISGSTDTNVSANLSGLPEGRRYHYRVVATSGGVVVRGADMTFTTNRPPTFSGYDFGTPFQTQARVSRRKLAAKGSDPDRDVLTVGAADPTSVHGGTVVLEAAELVYTPPVGFSGTDTFALNLTDGHGGSASGLVTVNVGSPQNSSGAGSLNTNPPILTFMPGGQLEIRFQGIPGHTYQIQRSIDMATWSNIATITAASNGALTHIDANMPQPSAFYRLSSQ